MNSASKFGNSSWIPAPTGHQQVYQCCIEGFGCIDANFIICLLSSPLLSSCLPTNRKREIWSWLQESANRFLRRTEVWLSRMTIWRNEWDKSQRRSAHTLTHSDESFANHKQHSKWTERPGLISKANTKLPKMCVPFTGHYLSKEFLYEFMVLIISLKASLYSMMFIQIVHLVIYSPTWIKKRTVQQALL